MTLSDLKGCYLPPIYLTRNMMPSRRSKNKDDIERYNRRTEHRTYTGYVEIDGVRHHYFRGDNGEIWNMSDKDIDLYNEMVDMHNRLYPGYKDRWEYARIH